MTREEAINIVDELVKSPNIRSHCLAAEAAMRSLWDYFSKKGKVDWGSREEWGIIGLLHDADYDALKRDVIASGESSDNYEATILEKHTDETVKRLREIDSPKEIIDGVRGHCDKEPRKTLAAKSIYAADELTGLIVASTLVRPDKKLAGLTVDSVLKRFKEPAFAKGANRDQIKTAESELGLDLQEFTEIVLKSMKGIAKDLGL